MKLILTTLFVLIAASAAQAKPAFFEEIQAQFPEATFTARCQTCHRVGSLLNVFGQDFKKLLKAGLNEADGWEQLKALDSDGDGVSNLDEILADTTPGKAN